MSSTNRFFPYLFLISFILAACNHTRQVVPYEQDTDEIFAPLQPNEEEMPEFQTFGKDSIPGFIFDFEMTTSNHDVFVYYQNLTVLDINPRITYDVLDFSLQQLCEYGFINDSINFTETEYQSLLKEGLNYKEASARTLDKFKEAFDSTVETYDSIVSPFNIYFQIYPVFLNKEIVTYRESAYCYTGGAHGMSISYLRTYDLSTGSLLTLADIVKPERLEEVREEVAAHMAYSYPIYENITSVDQYIDSLNSWLDNFETENEKKEITLQNYPLPDPALTEEGLVFIYQMYELTPGSDGCPVVLIPYKDIRGCLKINP